MNLKATADLVDEFADRLVSCDTQMQQFGGVRHFAGPAATVRCHQDNGLVKQILNTPGEGRILVIDGGGSVHTALIGDLVAGAAVANGWVGIVINGAVRDTVALRELPLGVKALGTNPRKSSKLATGESDMTVTFGGADFVPGQIVVCDDDGVVVLASELTLTEASK